MMQNACILPFVRPSDAPPPLETHDHVPVRPAPRSPVETGGRRGEYGLGDLARQLRFPDWTIRTIVAKLRVLTRDAGMPLPTTPRILRDAIVNGPEAIHAHSRWDAGAWDAWLQRYRAGGRPVDPAPSVPPPVRARMALVAQQIGQGRA